VAPLVEFTAPTRSPFPSDYFTVADDAQLTGRRVNLPMPPDCATNRSECADRAVLNQLDGFNMQPRISTSSGILEARAEWPARSDDVFFLPRPK
jgi:hypothetical protein